MTKLPLLSLAFAATLASADIAGSWRFNLVSFGEELFYAKLDLKLDGDKLTGNLNDLKIEGAIQGETLKFTASRPNGNVFATLEGRVNGQELSGTAHRDNDDFQWVARRAILPTAAPQIRTFEPTEFHRFFSGTIPPALHINPGDTVRTTTVDAGGRDASSKRRSNGGNPETGPFVVEGAMPGDTLVVKFNRIRLNRNSAESGDRVVPSALNPPYIRDAKYDDNFDSEWKLDRDNGFAMLAKPSEHLKNFRVKLQPMLGCVAVAPPDKQTFQAGWLGSWGGNMDYNGLREGTIVYLPVYPSGRLAIRRRWPCGSGRWRANWRCARNFHGRRVHGQPDFGAEHQWPSRRKRRLVHGDGYRRIAPRRASPSNHVAGSMDRARLQAHR